MSFAAKSASLVTRLKRWTRWTRRNASVTAGKWAISFSFFLLRMYV
jgi:hypothetical protein